MYGADDKIANLKQQLMCYRKIATPDAAMPGEVVKAIPGRGSNVPITLLGSGLTAQLAAMEGLPFR